MAQLKFTCRPELHVSYLVVCGLECVVGAQQPLACSMGSSKPATPTRTGRPLSARPAAVRSTAAVITSRADLLDCVKTRSQERVRREQSLRLSGACRIAGMQNPNPYYGYYFD